MMENTAVCLLLGSEGRQGGVTPWVRRDRARVKKARWEDKAKERKSIYGPICPVYPGIGL